MTRKLTLGLAAVLALSAARNSMAALTGVELHQYYGGALINDAPGDGEIFGGGGDLTMNPTIQAMPGDTVYLSIWIKPQLGDKTGGLTSIRAYHFEQYGVGDGASYVGGDTRNTDFYSNEDEPVAGTGGPHDNCADRLQLVDRMGAAAAGDGGFQSDGLGLPFDDAGNGAFFLGWVAFQAGAPGSQLDLYFAVPDDGVLRYATNATSGSLNTVGYGANPDGTPNGARCDNDQADVLGTVADRSSTVADATIVVVPEPTTMGLLALGLLAIRRRRVA